MTNNDNNNVQPLSGLLKQRYTTNNHSSNNNNNPTISTTSVTSSATSTRQKRSALSSPITPSPSSTKQKVSPMTLFKTIFLPHQRILLLLYPFTVIIGTILGEFEPESIMSRRANYFADKRNFLNVFFVKWGWGWTLLPLLIYVPLTIHLITQGQNKKEILRGLLRLILATMYWFVLTHLSFIGIFYQVHVNTGECSVPSSRSSSSQALGFWECKKAGGRWEGFDISGHCFLLVHASLVLIEELRVRKLFPKAFDETGASPSKAKTSLEKNSTSSLKAVEGILLIFMVFLIILWYVMLMATSLYFHSWKEKFVGVCFGMAFWMGTYVIAYKRRSNVWFPRLPGTV